MRGPYGGDVDVRVLEVLAHHQGVVLLVYTQHGHGLGAAGQVRAHNEWARVFSGLLRRHLHGWTQGWPVCACGHAPSPPHTAHQCCVPAPRPTHVNDATDVRIDHGPNEACFKRGDPCECALGEERPLYRFLGSGDHHTAVVRLHQLAPLTTLRGFVTRHRLLQVRHRPKHPAQHTCKCGQRYSHISSQESTS